jgi:hypothetical protein
MAARLAGLPAELEGFGLQAAPVSWGGAEVAARLGPLAPALARYELLWGVTATVSLPEGLATATAHVLCMPEPLQAFGAFVSLRVSDGVPAALGEDAQWARDRLLVWQGSYLVALETGTPRARVEAHVLKLAQGISARLPLPERKPMLVRLMPSSRLQPLSLAYWPAQVPDVPLLSRALTAAYVGEVGDARLVLADLRDDAEARAAYRRVVQWLDDTGLRWPLPGLGPENQVIPSEAHGLCLVLCEGPYVVALLDVTDRALGEALFRITLTHIHTIRP